MTADRSSHDEGTDKSLLGCLGAGVLFIVLFGIVCGIGGYWVALRLTRVDQQPVAMPAAEAKPAAPAEAVAANKAAAANVSADIKSKNRLRQIMLAMHSHHSQFRSYPPPASASYDADGKPLLSWRVHLLPFLQEKPLYEKFHRDEPWDSEHNRGLVDRMPDVYRSRGIACNLFLRYPDIRASLLSPVTDLPVRLYGLRNHSARPRGRMASSVDGNRTCDSARRQNHS